MHTLNAYIGQIQRPKTLLRAARACARALPAPAMGRAIPGARLAAMIEAEAACEDLRQNASAEYDPHRHIRALACLLQAWYGTADSGAAV